MVPAGGGCEELVLDARRARETKRTEELHDHENHDEGQDDPHAEEEVELAVVLRELREGGRTREARQSLIRWQSEYSFYINNRSKQPASLPPLLTYN